METFAANAMPATFFKEQVSAQSNAQFPIARIVTEMFAQNVVQATFWMDLHNVFNNKINVNFQIAKLAVSALVKNVMQIITYKMDFAQHVHFQTSNKL